MGKRAEKTMKVKMRHAGVVTTKTPRPVWDGFLGAGFVYPLTAEDHARADEYLYAGSPFLSRPPRAKAKATRK